MVAPRGAGRRGQTAGSPGTSQPWQNHRVALCLQALHSLPSLPTYSLPANPHSNLGEGGWAGGYLPFLGATQECHQGDTAGHQTGPSSSHSRAVSPESWVLPGESWAQRRLLLPGGCLSPPILSQGTWPPPPRRVVASSVGGPETSGYQGRRGGLSLGQ